MKKKYITPQMTVFELAYKNTLLQDSGAKSFKVYDKLDESNDDNVIDKDSEFI